MAGGCRRALFAASIVLRENLSKRGGNGLDFNEVYFILFFFFLFFLIAQQVLISISQVSQFHAGLQRIDLRFVDEKQ